MNADQMQAARDLIEYARDQYGKTTGERIPTEVYEAALVLEEYLDQG